MTRLIARILDALLLRVVAWLDRHAPVPEFPEATTEPAWLDDTEWAWANEDRPWLELHDLRTMPVEWAVQVAKARAELYDDTDRSIWRAVLA